MPKDQASTIQRPAPAAPDRARESAALQRPARPLTLVVAFLVLLGAVVVAGVLVVESRSTGANVMRSQQAIAGLARTLTLLQAAESGQRGYLLTADPAYLEPYRNSIDQITPALDALEALMFDNPRQMAALAELRPLVLGKLAEMDRTIGLFDAGDAVGAFTLLNTDAGNTTMAGIRDLIVQMDREANRRLANRIDSWTANGDWLFAVIGAAFLVVAVTTVITFQSMRRYLATIEAARGELEETNADLERRVQERTAEIQAANDEIQKFAYVVSHDLRSPLVNIMGFTNELEMLRPEFAAAVRDAQSIDRGAADRGAADTQPPRDIASIDADFKESLDFIKQSTAKMDRLINAVLRLARSGQRQFKYERLDTTELVEGIARTLKHQTEAIDAEILVERLPPLTTDRLAFEQIFTNLLDNALKYLDEGRPGRIVVRGATALNLVRFDVVDNGRGIEEGDLQRVFELFRRAGVQDKPGEGIGLAHIRTLIRRLGGRISCTSEAGKGSTFSVWLPHGESRQGQKERTAS